MTFRSLLPILSVIVFGTAASACKKTESEPPPATGSATSGTTVATPVEEPAHGGHGAQHGGSVLMDERGHVEIVLKADGAVEVWLSDNQRKPLPASTASTLELGVTRPGEAAETLALARDASDGAWTGKTKPITDPATKIHFGYNAAGKAKPYQIDITLGQLHDMQAASEPAHDDGHREHDDAKGDGHADHDHAAPDTHQGDGHSDHGGAPSAAPATLKDAVAQLDTAYQQLATIVKDGDLSKAHEAADKLADIGEALPDLAAKAKLGADEIKTLTVAGKKLRLFFKDIDEAGDTGKRDAAQKAFARYQEPIATIKAKAALAK